MNAFAMRNAVFFGRHEDGVLENEFSGNLVEICPSGVFTDKTPKRHYARKWDQQFAPSVCVHCALGCNLDSGERYATLRRVVNRCIFCGYCEEARPTYAIQLTPDFEMGEVHRQNLVYDKQDSLIDSPGKYPDYNYW